MNSFRYFKGLNNSTDPLRLGMSWLVAADNVHITDTGALEKRNGYALRRAGSFVSAYAALDGSRMFLVTDSGEVQTHDGITIATIETSAPIHWAEVNGDVYFTNGVSDGIIKPDGTFNTWSYPMPSQPTLSAATGSLDAGIWRVRCTFLLGDGRETGAGVESEIVLYAGQSLRITDIPKSPTNAKTLVYIAPANSRVFQHAFTTPSSSAVWNQSSNALGYELRNSFFDPLPRGEICSIQFWMGRCYVAQYLQEIDQTVVWNSEPMGYHLFNLASGFFMVAGRVTMLAPAQTGLIVGTNNQILAYDGEKIAEIAPYGAMPGQHWVEDTNNGTSRILFWSTRGICSALPFANLTEANYITPAPIPAWVCAGISRGFGSKRYISVFTA